MRAWQLDLFAADPGDGAPAQSPEPAPLRAADLADADLLAALPGAGLATAPELAAEAARRRLAGAVPALERLCRRLVGFGIDRLVPEQMAALAAIGGEAARRSVGHIIAEHVVQGPTLAAALAAAARLGSSLPAARLRELLRDAEPSIRAGACHCAGRAPMLAPLLIDLLDDLHAEVAAAAACALGRMGRPEARPLLLRLLRERPAPDPIEAIAPVADEAAIVILGRIARTLPALADTALAALEQIDDPRAAALAARGRSPR